MSDKPHIDMQYWPIYEISKDFGRESEIPIELMARYERIYAEFSKVQEELYRLWFKAS